MSSETGPGRQRVDVRAAIDSYVALTAYVPASACQISDLSALPPPLMRRVLRDGRVDAWLAWQDGPRYWFVEARALPVAMGQDQIVRFTFRDADGRAVAAGVWTRRVNGDWKLVEPLETARLPPAPG